jgi:curved DNA-binding protein CbpA
MGTRRTHYEVLGVVPTATQSEIRRAYRALVVRHHPDTGGSSSSTATLTQITDAWTVLSDTEKRRKYDRDIHVVHAEPKIDVSYVANSYAPARFPWRAMLFTMAVGAVVVLLLHALSNPVTPGKPDQLLTSGSCVDITTALSAIEVSCDGPHQAVVQQLIAYDRTCATGTEPYRDQQGMGLACIVRVDVTTSSGH